MVVYHFVPPEEIQLHEAASACDCKPKFITAGPRFWLGPFIGFQFFRHHRFSPLKEKTDARNFVAVGEEVEEQPEWA